MSSKIPLSVPRIKGNEWKYVKECLDTEWVSSAGKYVDRFEEEIARFTQTAYAVACVNGTSALHVALRIAGVLPGDEVILPTLTFIAPVNAARYLGAEPVFMDCDDYYNLDAEKTIEFLLKETMFKNGITIDKRSGRKIAAVVPVHVFGNAVDLEDLREVCQERNIRMVEDASESLGTVYNTGKLKGKHCGTVGDIGCLSFNGNKIITTGGGGMILTHNEEYACQAKYLTTQAKDDELKYIHNDVGYNYRLTNIQAALGVAQMERLPEFLEIKKKNYMVYKKALDTIPGLHVAEVPPYANNNHWMYALQIRPPYPYHRDGLLAFLKGKGVETRPVWELNHRQRPYAGCFQYRIEKALDLYDATLNIPCSVGLTQGEMQKVRKSLTP